MDQELFKKKLQEIADTQAASTKSPVISKEKYDAIKSHLMNPDVKIDAHFKHWVKTRMFQMMDLSGLGLKEELVIPTNENKRLVDCAPSFLRVVHADDLYAVVKGVHDQELNHSGYKKVMEYIQRHFFGITRGFVQEFCKSCPVCKPSQSQVTRPQLRPIVHKDFLERAQIDVIDMRHSPDGEFNYIGHFEDHFSKYHVLFPLKRKTAGEVSEKMEERVLAYFGPPKIFHSNNGREFVNELIRAMFERWGGDTTFVNGKPRHSQSQGLVQRGNRSVEEKIAAMKQDENLDDDETGYPWASWLPRIMFAMNSTMQQTIKDVPYHVVFGRSVPAPVFPGAKKHNVNEEDIEDK